MLNLVQECGLRNLPNGYSINHFIPPLSVERDPSDDVDKTDDDVLPCCELLRLKADDEEETDEFNANCASAVADELPITFCCIGIKASLWVSAPG